VRILWVKAGKLLPVDTGGKIRSYNLLTHLAQRNETTLLSYYDGPPDKDYEEQIERELPGAITVNTGRRDSFVRQAVDYFRHLPGDVPYAVAKFTSTDVQRLVSASDRERRFDVTLCDFLSASKNFPASLNTPAVLFQHNVESALWQRQAQHEPNFAKRLVFKIEAAKMTRYERLMVKRFDHIIAVSEHDRVLMSSMTDPSRISVVATGVDLKEYAELADPQNDQTNGRVLFLGSMDWEANIDGVDYFCRGIWPQVKSHIPEAKFWIVGRNPHARVKKWASESIEVTGRVDSVRPYLQQADVFVVPLRIGGGTRLKIYEAMAAGKAVVATTIGAEGLDVDHNKNILIADTEEAFATAVINLLRDHAKRRQLGAEAARLAAKYDWAIIAKRFEIILSDVVEFRAKNSRSAQQLAPVGA
jgi:glycosyltransferase involved in cell wall biosynthesis